MAYGNKIKDNEMNLVYKYYGNFTAKENYIFRQLVFNSTMVYNKVNWYFLKNGFNSKLQPQIVRKLSYEDQNGKYFTTQECGKIVDSVINDWKSFLQLETNTGKILKSLLVNVGDQNVKK